MCRSLFTAALLGLLIAITGCGQQAKPVFQSTDVTGAPIGGEFRLTGHDGKLRSLSDFKGKAVVLFFGFTHCPDVCPTTMSELAIAMKQLGEKANQVQVLFVSVDPERDTPTLLSQYVPAFNPGFIGLTGSQEEIRAVADKFKIVYQKSAPGGSSNANNYTVDHSAGAYIIDKQGQLRLFVNYGAGSAVFAHDLALLL
ncbi:SCO family protein [Chitinimonas sp. PSY-7]|uniref:SCO family protein n=1 Tax=Chitinimonas sp. PSY-7 TaxID=3459088 RepID=UPI0040403492